MDTIKRIADGIKTAALALTVAGALATAPAAWSLPDIYPAPEQAKPDLKAAIGQAHAEHRRVIVDFGGNWCTDCHVLDSYMHDPANQPIIDRSFLVVHVNVGQRDQNLDLARRYHIPLSKGVPALAVLDSRGKLLYSQKGGEFEAMRRMDSSSVTEFLQRWKAR